ncbi:ATP-binding protein [Streptomyces sp. enrichment culture]|uniref:ATP-binding protein n=1 Tax=Streptomyces sp. enrichment culture TaxID=1795815 RepID=UPI003F55571B
MTFRAPAPKSLSFCVPPDAGSVSSARRRVVATIRDWDLPLVEDTVETLELLAGEVIANAVVHTGRDCRTTVSWDGTCVRLETEDTEGGPLPQRAPAGLDEESGRGLQLVHAFAQRWGSRPTPDGKSVWFEIGGCSSSPPRSSPAVCRSGFPFGGAQRPVTATEPGNGVHSGSSAHATAT